MGHLEATSFDLGPEYAERTAPAIMQSDGVTITIPGGDGVSGLAPGDTDYLLLIAYLPSTASNDLQGLSQKYSVNLSAVQPAPDSISARATRPTSPFSRPRGSRPACRSRSSITASAPR